MAHYTYYIGNWIKDDEGSWVPPTGAVGSVDLGSIADISSASGSTRNVGFFWLPEDISISEGYENLGTGDCREMLASISMKSAWNSLTGVSVVGDTLVDLLWYHLTQGADPDGDTTCLPLMPTANNQLELWLQGHSLVKAEGFIFGKTHHTDKIKRVIQNNLQKAKKDSKDGKHLRPLFIGVENGRKIPLIENGKHKHKVDDRFYLRMARAYAENLRVPFSAIKPGNWREDENDLDHDTTITESFNTADSDTLGPDLSWTETSGDLDIVSNKCRNGALSSAGLARAESDVSSSDHHCLATCYLTGSGIKQVGPCARFSSSDTTFYWTRLNSNTPNFEVRLYKFVSGTATQLGSTSAGSGTTVNGTGKVECNGSSIKAIYNTTTHVSVTDTSITTGTRGGIRLYNAGSNLSEVTIDSFEVADLGTAAVDHLGILGVGI